MMTNRRLRYLLVSGLLLLAVSAAVAGTNRSGSVSLAGTVDESLGVILRESRQDTLVAVTAGLSEYWMVMGVIICVNAPNDWMMLWQCVLPFSVQVSRGWAEWNTAAIPENAEIERVAVQLHGLSAGGLALPDSIAINHLVNRPSIWGHANDSDSAMVLWQDCGRGPTYSMHPPPEIDQWQEYELGADAARALENLLSEGWFAIGLASYARPASLTGAAYSGLEGDWQTRPRLIVDYSATGVAEEAGLPGIRPGFTVGPNPVTGGVATLRFEGLGHVPRLTVTVFDVTGRSVLRRNIGTRNDTDRQGMVSLDLRSLSAGIYIVQMDAEGFRGTRKLVIGD